MKKKWFNVVCMMKPSGINYYVNIASPSLVENNVIKYIDYDLDIKLYGDGSTKLLDVSEYRKHAHEQNYPNEIRSILSKSVDDVFAKMNAREFPFQANKINYYYKLFKKTVNQ